MSFGKNPQVLSTVGSFRQMSHQFTKNQYGKKKAGGGVPYFVDQFELSSETIVLRLVPGEYLQDQIIGDEETEAANLEVAQVISPFIKFTDHFDGQKQRGAICSAGAFANIKTRREPCRGCDIFWATVARNPQGRLESSRMSRQGKYAFSIFDYSPYHKVEQYDQATGQVRKNNQTNEPYYNWLRCFGMGCDMCRAQKEWKQGHATHWNLSYTALQTIRSAETDIGKSCIVCGNENCIISRGWMCGGCGAEVVDMSSTQLKLDELLKLTDAPYGCGTCGQKVLLTEVYQCTPCTQQGHQGKRASVFDVDLKVKGLPNANGKGKQLQIAGWSSPYRLSAEVAALAKPLDLVARYKPLPLEAQIELFGEVPGAPAQTGRQPVNTGHQHTNPYGPAGGAPPGPPPGYQPPPQGGFVPPAGGYPPGPGPGFTPPPQGSQFQPPATPAPAPATANPYANPYAPRS